MLLENKQQYKLVDFQNYSELESKPEILSSLIECYKKAFSDVKSWGEIDTACEIKEKLKKELEGYSLLRLVMLGDSQKEVRCVIAFCWAQCLSGSQIIDSINTETGIKREDVSNMISDSTYLYLNDLGVIDEYRNAFPLGDLIMPVLSYVANISGTNTLFFWTIRNTPAALIAKAGRMDIIAEFGDIQFFRSKLHT